MPQQRWLGEEFEYTLRISKCVGRSARYLTCGYSWRCDEAFRLTFDFVAPVAGATIILRVDFVFTTFPVGY